MVLSDYPATAFQSFTMLFCRIPAVLGIIVLLHLETTLAVQQLASHFTHVTDSLSNQYLQVAGSCGCNTSPNHYPPTAMLSS